MGRHNPPIYINVSPKGFEVINPNQLTDSWRSDYLVGVTDILYQFIIY